MLWKDRQCNFAWESVGIGHSFPTFIAFNHPPQLQPQHYDITSLLLLSISPFLDKLTAKERERERVVKGMMTDKRERSVVPVAGTSPMESGGADHGGADGGGMRSIETMLRLLPVALCVVALVVMLKDTVTNDYGTLSYSNLGAFRYLVHANGICAGYSLLSAVVGAVPRPSTMARAWTFFLLDQLLTYVILGAGAVSTEVVYLAYKGDKAITWSQDCGSYGGFCKKATASVAITFVVGICYALLSLISSYRLFSKYDAPVAYNNKGIEIAAFGS